MKLIELWTLYEADKRIHGFSRLNLEDFAIVNGKGSKQREVYFTTECKVW